MARPTKYTPEIIAAARDYLDNFADHDDVIPSIAGLADVINIRRTTIYDWAKQEDKAEFSDILARILSRQEKLLMNNGLKGEFNSNIVKLALGKHGYSEKAELTGAEGKPLFEGVAVQFVKTTDTDS